MPGLKKILIFAAAFFAFATAAQAQHYVSVRGGYGAGMARFQNTQGMGFLWGLYHGGVGWKYYSAERSVGGIAVDLLYVQQGMKAIGLTNRYLGNWFDGLVWIPGTSSNENENTDSEIVYKRSFNSLMMPVMWQPHLYLFKRSVTVYFNAGVWFSYNFRKGREQLISTKYEENNRDRDYFMKLSRDNRFGYGLVGGAGLSVKLADRVEVFAEGRYYFGFSDILKNEAKYENNPLKSPVDNLQVAFGVQIRLGKGGILAPLKSGNTEKLQW